MSPFYMTSQLCVHPLSLLCTSVENKWQERAEAAGSFCSSGSLQRKIALLHLSPSPSLSFGCFRSAMLSRLLVNAKGLRLKCRQEDPDAQTEVARAFFYVFYMLNFCYLIFFVCSCPHFPMKLSFYPRQFSPNYQDPPPALRKRAGLLHFPFIIWRPP